MTKQKSTERKEELEGKLNKQYCNRKTQSTYQYLSVRQADGRQA